MAATAAAITIRKLETSVKEQLRMRAAKHGRSMEEEAREILRNALDESGATQVDLATSIRRRFAAMGGVELPIPAREAIRRPPDFGK
jgi:plasmid stability protein